MSTETVTLQKEPTTINYYLELKDGGIIQTYPGTAFEKRRKHSPQEIDIQDMRPIRSEITLDKAGFELVDHVSKVKDFSDENRIKEDYYPEMVALLKKTTGGDHVHVISHMSRSATTQDAMDAAKGKADTDFIKSTNPARFAHVDQSYRGAEQLLYLNLPEEKADQIVKKRWAIVNTWAPIGTKVTRDPLAFCDFRSVDENDFRTVVANLPPKGEGEYGNVSQNMAHQPRYEYNLNGERAARYEVTNMAYNPNQKWYYAPEMTPDEAWVFKIFDSKKDGRARCAVHSSFPLAHQPVQGDPRTSVELRAFVFWDDEETE